MGVSTLVSAGLSFCDIRGPDWRYLASLKTPSGSAKPSGSLDKKGVTSEFAFSAQPAHGSIYFSTGLKPSDARRGVQVQPAVSQLEVSILHQLQKHKGDPHRDFSMFHYILVPITG